MLETVETRSLKKLKLAKARGLRESQMAVLMGQNYHHYDMC